MVNVVFDATTAGSLHNTKDPETGNYITGKDIILLEWMLDIGKWSCYSIENRRYIEKIFNGSNRYDMM